MPVRSSKVELAIRLSIDLVALLVDRAVVAATKQREIRPRGGASMRPVTDVVSLAEPDSASGETAAALPMV